MENRPNKFPVDLNKIVRKPEHDLDEEEIAEKLKNLLIESVKNKISSLENKNVGLLFSGGLDSAIIAVILKKLGYDFTNYVALTDYENFKTSEDLTYSRKFSKEFNIPLKKINVSDKEIDENLEKVIELTPKANVVGIGIALPQFFGYKKVSEDNKEVIFSGMGGDGIFGGFNKHRKSENINETCMESLRDIEYSGLQRDTGLANYNDLGLICPFLDKELIEFSLKIPGKFKIKDNVEKHILRKAAKKLGVPEYITERKKKAIQYSSNFQKYLKKISKNKGFDTIGKYLKTKGLKKESEIWDSIAEDWKNMKDKPAKHTLDFIKNKKGKLLDLGGGSGRFLTNIPEIKMYLVDFSEKMIELAKEKAKQNNIEAEFYVFDVTSLPFENNFFDYAICNSIFHCLRSEKHKESVKELYRVLKPDGKAEITVWNKESKRFRNSGKEKYIRWRDKGKRYSYLFEPKEIYNLFKSQGFEITNKEDPKRMIVFIVKKPE